MCTQKMRALSYIGPEKITVPPKPDIHTYIQTDRRTDICFYRVTSLLKNCCLTDRMLKTNKRKTGYPVQPYNTVRVNYVELFPINVI